MDEARGQGEMNVKCKRFVVLLLVLGSVAGAQLSPSGEEDTGPFHIAVDVDLVVLHATVRDRKGRVVPDLRKQDFDIDEDGVRQSIRLFRHEDTPVTVGLVVDHSGSMQPKLAQVVAAARAFVQSSNPEDQMFVVNFNETVSLGLPDTIPFTNDATELEHAISNAPATGMTALYDAVAEGMEKLQAGSREKKVLLVVSDGGDNASAHSLDDVLKMAEQSSAIIYTVGLFDEADPDRNPRVLKRLAHKTGGEAFFPGELSAVVALCERIARDIRNQYTIGYFSSNVTLKQVYRAIRVDARAAGHGKLSVRTRAGYMAGKSPSGDDQSAP